ncbi:MAG: hypothetical protein JHC87_07655 [Thermoleophilaceae bacterium]|nr:hypothetical protein [Thermoleophilaceae bacterium]
MEVVLLILLIGVAHLIATGAKNKGYSYSLFFIGAFFVWFIAGLIVLLLPQRENPGAAVGSSQNDD